jgi:hypothetical protein
MKLAKMTRELLIFASLADDAGSEDEADDMASPFCPSRANSGKNPNALRGISIGASEANGANAACSKQIASNGARVRRGIDQVAHRTSAG